MPWSSHGKSHSHLHLRPHPECKGYYGRGCVQAHNGTALKNHNGPRTGVGRKRGSAVRRCIKRQHMLLLFGLLRGMVLQRWKVRESVISPPRWITQLVQDSTELLCFQPRNQARKSSPEIRRHDDEMEVGKRKLPVDIQMSRPQDNFFLCLLWHVKDHSESHSLAWR